jgi:hypothetical protein
MALQAQRERTTVRGLATQLAERAASDEYEARRRRWRDVNALRKPDRAPVWCRPVGCWNELLPPESLECRDPWLRRIETTLRQHLYKDSIGDDSIVEPWWGVPAAFDRDQEHTWGLPTQQLIGHTDTGGWRYDVPIKAEEDFETVSIPTFTYNEQRTNEALERMDDLLGDIMPVRLTCGPPLGAGLGSVVDQLRGMGRMMADLAERPHVIHRLMRKLLEGTLRAMRVAEDTGLLTPNNHGPMSCSDPINGRPDDGPVRLENLWCVANSQEFDLVSPAMWEEFLLNYQMPIFQQYGLVQYGCCESLTTKIDGVLRIPNLRTFVSSAWTDLDKVIAACGDHYTIMWRQKATDVVFAPDMGPIRTHLEEGMSKLQGCYYQVVLRELQTLNGRLDRLHNWAQTAIEVAEKYA